MNTTIDAAGRIVIPKEVRRQAGLAPGTVVEVRFRDGRVEIEAAPIRVKLVRQGPLLVAVPEGKVPPMTVEDVEAIREAVRRDAHGF